MDLDIDLDPDRKDSPMTTPPQGPTPGQPAPPPGPPQPEPKKKSRKWPWVVGAIVVVGIIIAVAGGGGDDDSTTANSTSQAPAAGTDNESAPGSGATQDGQEDEPAESSDSEPGIGTPVRDGKFEFTVTDVQSGLASVGDNPYLTKQAQGQYVIVTMTVQNTSNEPKGISPSDQELFDTDGRKFTADTTAAIGLDTSVAVWDQINPGNTVTLKVVYDMPADATPAEMELHDSMFSSGTTVSLR